jgi:hypothetical protein
MLGEEARPRFGVRVDLIGLLVMTAKHANLAGRHHMLGLDLTDLFD